MFSTMSNASKVAFITLSKILEENDFALIDCQVHTTHLESLGAVHIPRQDFLQIIKKSISFNALKFVF